MTANKRNNPDKVGTPTRAELVWAGKYDDRGQPKPIERTILPFQVVERERGRQGIIWPNFWR